MCAFCGEMTALFEGMSGDWICASCFRQEEIEDGIDESCDLGNDILGDLEQCLLNGVL